MKALLAAFFVLLLSPAAVALSRDDPEVDSKLSGVFSLVGGVPWTLGLAHDLLKPLNSHLLSQSLYSTVEVSIFSAVVYGEW